MDILNYRFIRSRSINVHYAPVITGRDTEWMNSFSKWYKEKQFKKGGWNDDAEFHDKMLTHTLVRIAMKRRHFHFQAN